MSLSVGDDRDCRNHPPRCCTRFSDERNPRLCARGCSRAHQTSDRASHSKRARLEGCSSRHTHQFSFTALFGHARAPSVLRPGPDQSRGRCMRSSAAFRRLRGQLSVATSSPWVWVATGVDPASAIHPPSRKRGSSLRGEYVSPASLNHELPTADTPEVAFIGRSNQGKSTLVGKLLKNPKLVRASKSPGCTKTVNYFALREGGAESPQAFLVDLPGYGFARESKRAVRGWNQAVGSYLEGRSSSVLRRTFVLVDGRHGLQPDDEQMLSFLSSRDVENMVVLTKVDKASPAQLVQSLEGAFQLAVHHPATLPIVHCISAHKGQGMGEFQNTLYGVSDL